MNMQEKTYNFFQILGFYKRKGRFALLSGLTQKVAKRSRLTLQRLQIRIAPLKFRKLAALKQPKFLHAPLISETRCAQTAEISSRSARNLLNASYVRPIHHTYI